MPEKLFKTYNNEVSLLVWQIAETEEEFLSQLPSRLLVDEELAQISIPQLRLEYLCGKLVAYRICEHLGISCNGTQKDVYGKPHLQGNGWEMSLTHSADYVAIVVHPTCQVGVDIEKPSNKLRKIMPRLFSPEENAMVGDDLVKMSWFWSAKEALYKLYGKRGIDFKDNLFLCLDDTGFTGEIRINNYATFHDFTVEKIDDYYLVFAV